MSLVVTVRIILVRATFATARHLPRRHRVVLATAHADRIGGNLATIRDELARREPPIPVVVLAHRLGRGWRAKVTAEAIYADVLGRGA